MARDKDQSLLTAAAEQCRFEEVRSRVQRARVFSASSHAALAAPLRESSLTRNLKIIALTSFAMQGDEEKCDGYVRGDGFRHSPLHVLPPDRT